MYLDGKAGGAGHTHVYQYVAAAFVHQVDCAPLRRQTAALHVRAQPVRAKQNMFVKWNKNRDWATALWPTYQTT